MEREQEQRQHPTHQTNDKVTSEETDVMGGNDPNNNNQPRRSSHQQEREIDVPLDKESTGSVRGSMEEAIVKEEGNGEITSPTNSDHHVVFPAVDPRSRGATHATSNKGRSHHSSNAGSDKRTSVTTRAQMVTADSRDEAEATMRNQAVTNNNNSISAGKNWMSVSESRWKRKSNGRKWMTSIKLSLWFTSVFTFVFCFFYFFLHVLLLVKVWDPVHTDPPVRDAGSQVDQFIDSLDPDGTVPADEEVVDDHRHSREKSIMSLILVLVLAFHSIIFYVFSSTLSKSIRIIDTYHNSLLIDPAGVASPPVYSIDPLPGQHSSAHHHHHHSHHHHRHSSSVAPGGVASVPPSVGQSNSGFQRHYRHPSSSHWKQSSLAEHHHEQYYHRKSRTRSRMDEEMGISRRDRHLLMYSFFGVLTALLCLLIHVMVQFVFCLALYQPYMDLMDCLLLIFSSFIIIFSLTFIFIASYYHRKKIYA